MPRSPHRQLFPLQVIGAEQHHQARALLEGRGLLVRADSPGGTIGPIGLAYGLTNQHGLLWVRHKHADEAQRLIEEAGIYVAGALRPIVDRSEPHCPQCGGELDMDDPDDDGVCASCGFEFTWIDISEPVVDPDGLLCDDCGYDLTGNTEGRCPECGTPISIDTSIIVNQAAREAGMEDVIHETKRPLSTATIVGSGLIVVVLILGIFLIALTALSDQLPTFYLVGGGVVLVLVLTISYLGDRARTNESENRDM